MLKTRIITALILLFGLLAALFLFPAVLWLAFCAAICGAAAWEWGTLARFQSGLHIAFAVFAGAAALLLGLVAGLGEQGASNPRALAPLYLASAAFWLLAMPWWLARKWQIGNIASGVAVGLIVLLPATLALAHLRQLGPWVLLAALSVAWVADIAAYFAGRAFGRHKLAPNISPGKTWEGAYGAAAGVVLFGILVVQASGLRPLSVTTLLALVPLLLGLTAISVIGDLFESLLKRQAGVKDSGNILPGHGGILDRIDSLTSTLPLMGLAALWLTR